MPWSLLCCSNYNIILYQIINELEAVYSTNVAQVSLFFELIILLYAYAINSWPPYCNWQQDLSKIYVIRNSWIIRIILWVLLALRNVWLYFFLSFSKVPIWSPFFPTGVQNRELVTLIFILFLGLHRSQEWTSVKTCCQKGNLTIMGNIGTRLFKTNFSWQFVIWLV